MTRITNFGRKRTYLEAGLASNVLNEPYASNSETEKETGATVSKIEESQTSGEHVVPPKKKRKRTKMSKRDGNTGILAAKAMKEREMQGDGTPTQVREADTGDLPARPTLSKSARKKKREKDRKLKVLSASENRRQKRIKEKNAATICFACREKGHAAKNCPLATNDGDEKAKVNSVVGICYRCGSTKHTLSRCKKTVNHTDPLPFALCFVCKGKGHLASTCPQNKDKGIYPNGGCCKLCGDISHLARDCSLRKQTTVDSSAILGVGHEAGADEDDFHYFKRQNTELDREQKGAEKVRCSLDIKAGTHSGIVKPFGTVPKASSKVVYF